MNLGGPVWHSSAASTRLALSKESLKRAALKALEGVGDPKLGEWKEWTGYAFHVRRRLSADEQRQVGPVVDVRGTLEGQHRVKRAWPWLEALVDVEPVLAVEVLEALGEPLPPRA